MFLQEDNTYWIILASFVMPLILSVVLIVFFVTYQRRKHSFEMERKNSLLKQQALIIENQRSLEKERTRIAGEMHDDLGSGLTTIKFLSEKALKQSLSKEERMQVERISEQSSKLVTHMSEIIWAMNSRFDTVSDLSGYIRRYASEYLEEHAIPIEFTDNSRNLPLSGEKRRTIFLVVKELLHNTVKHSGATSVEIRLNSDSDKLILVLRELGGPGFDADSAELKGNGIYNIRKRAESIGGQMEFKQMEGAMEIMLRLPAKSGKNEDT